MNPLDSSKPLLLLPGSGVNPHLDKGAAMTMPQELYGFSEREDLALLFFRLAAARFLSLSIKAVLRASSCARSSVEAGDKLPVPVLDKSGSAF